MSQDDDIDLGQYETAYAGTEVDESGLDDIEADDGEHDCRLEWTGLKRTTKSGVPYFGWKWRVIASKDAAQVGRVVWNKSFISDSGMPFLKKDLLRCGLKLAKIADLKRDKDKLIGVEVRLKRQTNGDFANVYLNRLLKAAPGLAAAAAGSSSTAAPAPAAEAPATAPGNGKPPVPF